MLLIKDDLFKYVTEDPLGMSDDTCLKNNAKTRATIKLCIENIRTYTLKIKKTRKQFGTHLREYIIDESCQMNYFS